MTSLTGCGCYRTPPPSSSFSAVSPECRRVLYVEARPASPAVPPSAPSRPSTSTSPSGTTRGVSMTASRLCPPAGWASGRLPLWRIRLARMGGGVLRMEKLVCPVAMQGDAILWSPKVGFRCRARQQGMQDFFGPFTLFASPRLALLPTFRLFWHFFLAFWPLFFWQWWPLLATIAHLWLLFAAPSCLWLLFDRFCLGHFWPLLCHFWPFLAASCSIDRVWPLWASVGQGGP